MFYREEDRQERFRRTGKLDRIFNVDEILEMSPQEIVGHFSIGMHNQKIGFDGDVSYYSLCTFEYHVGEDSLGYAKLYVGSSKEWVRWYEFYPVGERLKGRKIGTIAYAATWMRLLRDNLVDENADVGYASLQSEESVEWQKKIGIYGKSLNVAEELEVLLEYSSSRGFYFSRQEQEKSLAALSI